MSDGEPARKHGDDEFEHVDLTKCEESPDYPAVLKRTTAFMELLVATYEATGADIRALVRSLGRSTVARSNVGRAVGRRMTLFRELVDESFRIAERVMTGNRLLVGELLDALGLMLGVEPEEQERMRASMAAREEEKGARRVRRGSKPPRGA